MAEIRKIIKVFLASPGDMKEERFAAKEVVDEFNNVWADHLKHQIELVGWEDTTSSYGRPQEHINRDLEQCEYFIGMLSKRWGTPPDNSGRFSSGFEEEFERSCQKRNESASPEISLLFKKIEDDFLRDPGDDLKKVLQFKEKIENEKTVLYEKFGTVTDFKQKFGRCISRYIQQLQSAEERLRSEESETLPSSTASPTPEQDTTAGNEGPLTREGDLPPRTIPRLKLDLSPLEGRTDTAVAPM